MEFELVARVVLVAINAFGILLAWWVVVSGSKKSLKSWFILVTIFMLLWANFSYFGSRVENREVSILLYRINWAAVSLFLSSFYYFFVIHFLERGKWAKRIGIIIMSTSFIFFGLSTFSDLVIYDSVKSDWGNEIVFGKLGDLFNLFSAAVALIVTAYSLSAYRSSARELKIKLRYFIAGVFIFITANLIFNVGLQLIFKSVQYQFLGDFSSIILLAFTVYATVQHKLFDVKIIVTEAVSALLLVVLFSRIFAAQATAGRILDSSIFVLALILSYLLVRSVRREVEQRAELERLNTRLQELDKQKTEFLNVASHELRAPMTAVKGYISMARDGDGGEVPVAAQELLTEASEEAERMIRLVNNMLNVARIEEGRMVYQEGDVHLSEVADKIFDEFKFVADNKALEYVHEPSRDVRDFVRVDVDRIHEVVSNLVSNAIKYTDQGKISVRLLNPNPGVVRFEVEDTGPGMTPEEVGNLFQKFYRAQSYVGKKMGTGLGLYISKRLVEKFGGTIGVKSEKGQGSLFWFELPLKVAG